jgi:hypothetical protein
MKLKPSTSLYSHDGYEEFHLLGYNAVRSIESQPTFSRYLFHADFFLGLVFNLEYRGNVAPKRRLTFNGLRGVTSHKTEQLSFVMSLLARSQKALCIRGSTEKYLSREIF